ncbi:MAG: FAD-dependent monooxygenase [Chlorobi bacterium]|nr:FAD-dependent monooxygenase [Chlorobiota bacterium]MBX7216467.1 FAD-dependent monooxygenase [Candidatus Kapabacteria bacterium]
MPNRIALLGAGLTGPLLAVYLARRGYAVDLYERRPDMRVHDVGGGRSINLALSTRGLRALEGVGLQAEVLADAIRMPGRMIHALDGSLDFQPYGKVGEAINSISRSGLNIILLNAAERAGVRVHFNARCESVSLKERTATLVNDQTGERTTIAPERLIAADGANSSLRAAMELEMPGFDSRTEWLEHGYKELEIPPGPNGEFLMEPNALHIWPRHEFMMIALPNPNATFTCTVFAAFDGEDGFDTVLGDDAVNGYFQRHFPDALPLMPTLLHDWRTNPSSRLGTVFCGPWHLDDWGLLIGDAAHAIVPFYGQGMNCCFEDCFVLDTLLADSHDWGSIMPQFYALRKPNADAIARLAVANFFEMRSRVVDPHYLRKKSIEARLHELFPDRWMPLYSMVTFSTIGYAEALQRSGQQDALLQSVGFDTVEGALQQGKEATEKALWG